MAFTSRALAAVFLAGAFALAPSTVQTFGAALAQTPPAAENIVIDFGFGVYRIPRLEAIGANVTGDELRALLTSREGAAHERLRRIEAAELYAPTIEFEQVLPTSRQTQTFRDVHMQGVRNGRIERIVSASSAISGAIDGESVEGATGLMSMQGVDVATLVEILSTGGAKGAVATIYEQFSMDRYTTRTPKFDMEMREMSGRGVRLASTDSPAIDLLRRFATMTPNTRLPPAEALGVLAGAMGVVRAFGMDDSTVRDWTMVSKDPATPFTLKVSQMGMRDVRDGVVGSIGWRQGEITTGKAKLRLGQLELSGFDMRPVFETMSRIAKDPSLVDSVNPALLAPQFDRLMIAGLERSSDAPGDTLKVGLDALRIERAQFDQGGRVVRWSAALEQLRASADKDDPQLAALRAFGYDSIDGSWKMAIDWKPANSELVLSDFVISGVGVGSASLTAQIANVSEAIFTADRKAAAVALLPAGLRSAELKLTDAGVIDKYVAQQARATKRKPAEARKTIARDLGKTLAQLGDAPAAATVSKALVDFVTNPKMPITVSAVADPSISAIDVATVKPPQGLWRRVKIEVKRR